MGIAPTIHAVFKPLQSSRSALGSALVAPGQGCCFRVVGALSAARTGAEADSGRRFLLAAEAVDQGPKGICEFALRPVAAAAGDYEGGVLERELGECGAVVFARRVLAPAGLHRVVGDVDFVVVVDVLGEDQRDALQELLAGRCPDRPGASAFTLFEERLLELARGVHNARRMTLGPDGLEGLRGGAEGLAARGEPVTARSQIRRRPRARAARGWWCRS
jgi:hypothetical protein